MTNQKRDPLKSLLRKVELDKPSRTFTDVVMEEVRARQEAVVNPALQSLLKRNALETPSSAFTQRVLAQVETLDFQPTHPSIVSKKAWLTIISSIGLLFSMLVFFGHAPQSPEGLTGYFIHIGSALGAFFARFNSIPVLYPITVISIGGVLVVDYVLRIRSQETK